MKKYQERLAAQDTYGVLLCLQALDAGKNKSYAVLTVASTVTASTEGKAALSRATMFPMDTSSSCEPDAGRFGGRAGSACSTGPGQRLKPSTGWHAPT
ncbi:hypothetical protein OHA28_49660 [Streptomyces sp. NBC_00269]|nr:hypothetical protein [Streptomyces sp. NBC_00269]